MTSPFGSGGSTPPKLRVYSVIAGANKYENSGQLPDLAGAERDAWRVSQLIAKGNEVIEADPTAARTTILLGKQVTSVAIRSALRKLYNRADLGPLDIIFFYFAGHGTVDDSDGYLCCYNYTPSNPSADSIRFTELYNDVQGMYSSANVIVALDSCFSGAIVSPNQIGGNAVQQVRNILRNQMTGNGTRTIYAAAQAHQRAREDNSVDFDENTKESGGGYFTSALIHGWFLGEGCAQNGRLSLNDLATYIQENLQKRQNSSFGADRLQEPIYTTNGSGIIINMVSPLPVASGSSTATAEGQLPRVSGGKGVLILPTPQPPKEETPTKPIPWGRIALFSAIAVALVTACSVATLTSTTVFAVWLGAAVLMAILSVPLARSFGVLTGLVAVVQFVLLFGLANLRFGWWHNVGVLDGIAQWGWLATVIFLLEALFDVAIITVAVLGSAWSTN